MLLLYARLAVLSVSTFVVVVVVVLAVVLLLLVLPLTCCLTDCRFEETVDPFP